MNLYRYANNDPINFSDPTGLDPCDSPWQWIGKDEECYDGSATVPIYMGEVKNAVISPSFFLIPDMFAAGFPDLGAALSRLMKPSGSGASCAGAGASLLLTAVSDGLFLTGVGVGAKFVTAGFKVGVRSLWGVAGSVARTGAHSALPLAVDGGMVSLGVPLMAHAGYEYAGRRGVAAGMRIVSGSSVDVRDFIPGLATARAWGGFTGACGL